ncbi:polysaccharide biosynthesis protein [Streptococcus bovimastitidis]|uniref:Polysaccharide biosynthesis protein n=1 Tax=Streptococcus bovimastitidis TaxID=1856638 RepID=A0A1L8MPI6_9STRE|nr:oligosaccharide flippase family protein [Streptococcus bovimastitidis]OJF72646.1 polysaccharide biosynthesis protein [Streptococcus bovimastitidis]
MKLVKNMIYNTSFQLLSLILPLITIPYISRVLTPEGVGINAFTLSIANYFTLAGALGINLYGNREIASFQKDKEKRSKVFWELVYLKFFSATISLLVYLIFISFVKEWQILYLLQGINLIATMIDISWYFIGVEDFKKIVVRNAVVKLTTVALTFILIKDKSDLGLYIFLIAFSMFLGNLTVWPFLKNEINYLSIKELNVFRHLKPALYLFLPQITMQIYLSLNKSMLGLMDSVHSAGYFDQSDKLIRVLFTIVTAIGGVFLPRLSSLFAEKKFEEAKILTLKLLEISNAISFLMISGTVAVSSSFAIFFFGKDFSAVGPLMAVQSIMVLLISYGNAFGGQYLLASHRTRSYTLSAVFGLIVNIIANIVLIPGMGAMGAILSSVLTEFMVSFYQVYSLRDVFSPSEIFGGILKYFLAALISTPLMYFLDLKLADNIINYGILTIIGSSTYILILVVLKAPVVKIIKR